MITSNNKKLSFLLHLIGPEKISEMENYVCELLPRSYHEFQTAEEVVTFFQEPLQNFYLNHSLEDISLLRSYSGIMFRSVNSLLRNKWNYEYNGKLTEDLKLRSQKMAKDLFSLVHSFECSKLDFKVYRGCPLSSFLDYGITSMEQLLTLKDQYLYDSGFTSTSFVRSQSFFHRALEFHDFCNVEVTYLIPFESQDGIPLISDHFSYSKSQTEYLLNSGNLAKVLDVTLANDRSVAYLTVALIPRKIWDPLRFAELEKRK